MSSVFTVNDILTIKENRLGKIFKHVGELKVWMYVYKIVSENGCWTGLGSLRPDGYRELSFKGKKQRMHRIAYTLFCKKIPEGLFINHICGFKGCFNPEHLEVVTHQQNMQHAVESGLKKQFNNKRKIKFPMSLNDEFDFEIIKQFAKLNSTINGEKWIWFGSTDNNNYPLAHFKNHTRKLHRWIMSAQARIRYQDFSKDIVVGHKDGNTLNVNPNNLILGSASDNQLDCKWKRKQSKLTKEDVVNIKTEIRDTFYITSLTNSNFDASIAKKYNVSPWAIRDIRCNRRHGEVSL